MQESLFFDIRHFGWVHVFFFFFLRRLIADHISATRIRWQKNLSIMVRHYEWARQCLDIISLANQYVSPFQFINFIELVKNCWLYNIGIGITRHTGLLGIVFAALEDPKSKCVWVRMSLTELTPCGLVLVSRNGTFFSSSNFSVTLKFSHRKFGKWVIAIFACRMINSALRMGSVPPRHVLYSKIYHLRKRSCSVA